MTHYKSFLPKVGGEGGVNGKNGHSNAFRLLPICPKDLWLYSFKIYGFILHDYMLAHGFSISCSLFKKFSTFLHWEVQHRSSIQSIVDYLDDLYLIEVSPRMNVRN